jgi:ATP-dependent Clp protease ATP-binding subunit ClpX
MENPMSENQIDAIVELAISTYNKKENRTKQDLLQCEQLFLRALDSRVASHGKDSSDAAYIHWYLGLVYGEMNDHFEEGEAHYAVAFRNYTDPMHQAAIANNHANLLIKKGNLINEEAEEAKENFEATARPEQSEPSRSSDLPALLSSRNSQAPGNAGKKVVSTLLDLTTLQSEAADAFKRAAELRKQAYDLVHPVARSAEKKKEETKKASAKAKAEPIIYKSPVEIVAHLDQVAIGQRAAKRGLANAAAQHIKRMQLSAEARAKTDKSNVLLMGPTGCGKTLLARGLAQAINVPFYATEATKLTAAGYVGADVNSILVGLLKACDFDVERAQNGIIYVDEIDKIAASGDSSLDVGGESVQEELLTILEGTVVSVPKNGNNKSSGEYIEIDTTNILFIVGGAFVRLGEIVARRLATERGSSIGFGAQVRSKDEDPGHFQKQAVAKDFVDFGMIPEFVGRLPKRLVIETLSVDQLERILVEPEKALITQKRLLLASTTDVRFTAGAIRAIAEEAHKTGTHGRALREIVEQVLEPIVFDEPEVAIITAAMVLNRGAEIEATNREEDGVKVAVERDYIVADDQVEVVRKAALAVVQERREHPSAPGSGRAIVVLR